jgi:hypothetical protein
MNWLHRLPRVIRFQAIGFGCILALAALNEYLDLPKILFGEEPTPLRHHEFLMESLAVFLVAVVVLGLSWFADRRLRELDSLLVMCSWCRQVRVANRWIPLEEFLKERAATIATYGLCPACCKTNPSHAPLA